MPVDTKASTLVFDGLLTIVTEIVIPTGPAHGEVSGQDSSAIRCCCAATAALASITLQITLCVALVRFRIAIPSGRRRGQIAGSFLLLKLADNLRFFPRLLRLAQPPVNSRERDVGREFFWVEVDEVFEEWFCSGKISALQ